MKPSGGNELDPEKEQLHTSTSRSLLHKAGISDVGMLNGEGKLDLSACKDLCDSSISCVAIAHTDGTCYLQDTSGNEIPSCQDGQVYSASQTIQNSTANSRAGCTAACNAHANCTAFDFTVKSGTNEYVRVGGMSGNVRVSRCSDSGNVMITSITECEAAAKALGMWTQTLADIPLLPAASAFEGPSHPHCLYTMSRPVYQYD